MGQPDSLPMASRATRYGGLGKLTVCLTSFQEVKYAKLLARPALWRTNVIEEPRLHIDCRPNAGAGHWREHGDLQRRQRRAVERDALSETGATGDGLVRQPAAGNP